MGSDSIDSQRESIESDPIDFSASIDFFAVSTASFRILYVFLVLRHERRELVHFNVTEHPTAQWTGQQMAEAFPWDSAARYVPRDRDRVYGAIFRRRLKGSDVS